MDMTKTLYVVDRNAWRAWLAENHATQTEIWLIYYKKESGQVRIPYEEAVEEALCFGWIDSLIQRIDDDRFAQKFTPRKKNSKWSISNKHRIRKLIQAGSMTEPGLRVIPETVLKESMGMPIEPPREVIPLPGDVESALRANAEAWQNFQSFTEKYVQLVLRWISSAKKAATRAKRVQEFVDLTTRNEKIGMK